MKNYNLQTCVQRIFAKAERNFHLLLVFLEFPKIERLLSLPWSLTGSLRGSVVTTGGLKQLKGHSSNHHSYFCHDRFSTPSLRLFASFSLGDCRSNRDQTRGGFHLCIRARQRSLISHFQLGWDPNSIFSIMFRNLHSTIEIRCSISSFNI